MSELQTKIKKLSAAMDRDNHKIHQECHLLRNYLSSPAVIAFQIGSSFAAGYILSRYKSMTEIATTLVSVSLQESG